MFVFRARFASKVRTAIHSIKSLEHIYFDHHTRELMEPAQQVCKKVARGSADPAVLCRREIEYLHDAFHENSK